MALVKFFESNNIWKLQEQVNIFLNKLRGFEEVVDIKYNHMTSHLPQDNDDDWNVLYTAMVIYRNPVLKQSEGNVAQAIFKDVSGEDPV